MAESLNNNETSVVDSTLSIADLVSEITKDGRLDGSDLDSINALMELYEKEKSDILQNSKLQLNDMLITSLEKGFDVSDNDDYLVFIKVLKLTNIQGIQLPTYKSLKDEYGDFVLTYNSSQSGVELYNLNRIRKTYKMGGGVENHIGFKMDNGFNNNNLNSHQFGVPLSQGLKFSSNIESGLSVEAQREQILSAIDDMGSQIINGSNEVQIDMLIGIFDKYKNSPIVQEAKDKLTLTLKNTLDLGYHIKTDGDYSVLKKMLLITGNNNLMLPSYENIKNLGYSIGVKTTNGGLQLFANNVPVIFYKNDGTNTLDMREYGYAVPIASTFKAVDFLLSETGEGHNVGHEPTTHTDLESSNTTPPEISDTGDDEQTPENIDISKLDVSKSIKYLWRFNNGGDLKLIQKIVGLEGDDVDGIAGPKTARAIATYQAKNNLDVDGMPGKNTLKTMEGKSDFGYKIVDGQILKGKLETPQIITSNDEKPSETISDNPPIVADTPYYNSDKYYNYKPDETQTDDSNDNTQTYYA